MATSNDAITPPELARALGHRDGGKAIRRWLRTQSWRSEAEKGVRWCLSPEQADFVRNEFRNR
ncbi:hypothetical protein [Cryobacterium sp. Hh38]|uniref:hypothetical protein n=1 Tax=Cryobacterium sp. Hh38 TaxID=1259156 RepID=UPI00106A4F74|nr:hypothetical protein [Cryobacterium sp. Hh38]TFD66083.1 hypothetical protein E3T41_00040 [Cryobacterium sp. Hh38]